MGLFMKVVCKILSDQEHHVTTHKGQNPPPTKGATKRMNCSLVDKAKLIMFCNDIPNHLWAKIINIVAYLFNICSKIYKLQCYTKTTLFQSETTQFKSFKNVCMLYIYPCPQRRLKKTRGTCSMRNLHSVWWSLQSVSISYSLQHRKIIITRDGKCPL
jgi:hypothetical protein